MLALGISVQYRSDPSPAAEIAGAPSGENAQAQTQRVCPWSTARQAPEATSQSRSVLSWDAEIASVPCGENAHAGTQLVCPSSASAEIPSTPTATPG